MDSEITAYLEEVRAHRGELGEAMRALDDALAMPLGLGQLWRRRVRAALTELAHDLEDHVSLTEAPGGLYADLRTRSPRLASGVEAQLADHVHFVTEVGRLLDDPAGAAALRRFAVVLVGGSAVPLTLRERALAAGVRLVATYGMSESAGGCVYDGRPLPGVEIAIDDDERIHLGGPMIAHGYLGRPDLTAASFTTRAGLRWFATDDLGAIGADGRLTVHGRRDDVITTGGLKVHPRVVEEAVLTAYPGLKSVVAVGVPDPEWGQIVALAVTGEHPPTRDEVRDRLRGELAAYALPKVVRVLPHLPERGPGKPDRRAIAAMVGQ